MDRELASKERLLEKLKVDKEVEGTRAEIAERKAKEREMKKLHGRDWKKVFMGAMSSVRPNREAIQDLYAGNPELRELSRPRTRRLK